MTNGLRSRQIILLITLAVAVCVLGGCGSKAVPVRIDVSAEAAVIVEAGSGKVLFAKNADGRFPPASTTKVMTAIVALENLSPGNEITAGDKVLRVEPTIAGLKPGVRYPLEDLLEAILIRSANDAAVAIAEGACGSEEGFAGLMNAKAERLGMEDTFFATASGLPTGKKDSQYTTAKDLARMMRYALRHESILEIMSRKTADICGSDGRKIHLKTHNKSLLRGGDAAWGKTGYTRQARLTFVGVEASHEPRIVFAFLRSTDLWGDVAKLRTNGLELYDQRHRTVFSGIINWIKSWIVDSG